MSRRTASKQLGTAADFPARDDLYGAMAIGNEPWTWTEWASGMPLILFTVLIHVSGFGLSRRWVIRTSKRVMQTRHPEIMFVTVISLMTLLATSLHATEAGIWAVAYRFLGALPDNRSAMLYSLNAMTSYGHINLQLEERWHLMGAMEALNGWLLFGLSTAFLFWVVGKVFSSLDRRERDGA